MKKASSLNIVKDVLSEKALSNVDLVDNDLKEAKRSVLAFYNTAGGIIIFGITKELKLTGITDYKEITKKLNSFTDSLNQSKHLQFDSIIYNDKEILLVNVPSLPIEFFPAHLDSESDLKSLYRVNNKNEEMPLSHLHSILALKGQCQDEQIIVTSFRSKFEDNELLEVFIKEASEINRSLAAFTQGEILNYFRLKINSQKNLAYVLSFSLYPQIFYPYLTINVFTINKDNRNLLLEQIDGSISTMFYKTIFLIKKHCKFSMVLNGDNLESRCDYPLKVIEELVFNALVNRDYSYYFVSTPIKIFLRDDSIEIINPGEYIESGIINKPFVKYSRNPIIKKTNEIILKRTTAPKGMNYIRSTLKEEGYQPPIITSDNDSFSVKIMKERSDEVYHGMITIQNICSYCEIPRSKKEIYLHFRPKGHSTPYNFFNRYLEPLMKNNVLVYTIPDKPFSKFQKVVLRRKMEEYTY